MTDRGHLMFFGPWHERSTFPHVNVPVGVLCDDCEQPFVDGDQGVIVRVGEKREAFHRRCAGG